MDRRRTQPVAPLMGDFSHYDGGFCYADVGPSSFFLAYPDHGMVCSFSEWYLKELSAAPAS